MIALCLESHRTKAHTKIAASVPGGATLIGMVTAFIAGKKPTEKTT